jgi:hypothetical protein
MIVLRWLVFRNIRGSWVCVVVNMSINISLRKSMGLVIYEQAVSTMR